MYICFFSTRLRFSFSHHPAPRSPPLLHRTFLPSLTPHPNSLVPAPRLYFSYKMQAQNTESRELVWSFRTNIVLLHTVINAKTTRRDAGVVERAALEMR